jgi:hypothetical protein
MSENILYFSDKCSDTEEFIKKLKQKNISYREVNITESMKNLKEFLYLRDNLTEFENIIEQGKVGVPVLVTEKQILFEI